MIWKLHLGMWRSCWSAVLVCSGTGAEQPELPAKGCMLLAASTARSEGLCGPGQDLREPPRLGHLACWRVQAALQDPAYPEVAFLNTFTCEGVRCPDVLSFLSIPSLLHFPSALVLAELPGGGACPSMTNPISQLTRISPSSFRPALQPTSVSRRNRRQLLADGSV